VSLESSRFVAATPTFTLVGEISGGPPTTYTWTRDGVEITNSSSVSISLSLNTVPMEPPTQANAAAYLASLYRSTLTVTGVFPGVYQYSVSNRATTTPSTDSFNIEGTQHVERNVIDCILIPINSSKLPWSVHIT
jgi:hypothetical protein